MITCIKIAIILYTLKVYSATMFIFVILFSLFFRFSFPTFHRKVNYYNVLFLYRKENNTIKAIISLNVFIKQINWLIGLKDYSFILC